MNIIHFQQGTHLSDVFITGQSEEKLVSWSNKITL